MKKAFLFILLFLFASIGLAECSDYVALAAERLNPPYPNYFGAAGEYTHAADCYSDAGDLSNANQYYNEAAEHYIVAAGELVAGGDNYQRAKSFELAADAYAKTDMLGNATEYYNKAKDIYVSYGYTSDAAAVSGKITMLTEEEPQGEDFKCDMIGLISMILLFSSLLSIAYMFSKEEELRAMTVSRLPKPKPPEETFRSRHRDEFTAPEMPKEPEPEKPLTPKEKLAKKLKEKYKP